MIETLFVWSVVACSSSICNQEWKSLGEYSKEIKAGEWVSTCEQTAKELEIKKFKCVRKTK